MGPLCGSFLVQPGQPPFAHTPRSSALIGYALPHARCLPAPCSCLATKLQIRPPQPTTTHQVPSRLFPLFSPTTLLGLRITSCLSSLIKAFSNLYISCSRFRRHVPSCEFVLQSMSFLFQDFLPDLLDLAHDAGPTPACSYLALAQGIRKLDKPGADATPLATKVLEAPDPAPVSTVAGFFLYAAPSSFIHLSTSQLWTTRYTYDCGAI